MPELPEVEVTRLGLLPLLNGQVYDVKIRNHSLRWPINPDLKKILHTQELLSLKRRGKYLLAYFPEGCLIIHLGMSGKISIVNEKKETNKHDHVDILFRVGKEIIYSNWKQSDKDQKYFDDIMKEISTYVQSANQPGPGV